jgi:hypothetical protein
MCFTAVAVLAVLAVVLLELEVDVLGVAFIMIEKSTVL